MRAIDTDQLHEPLRSSSLRDSHRLEQPHLHYVPSEVHGLRLEQIASLVILVSKTY